MSSIYFDIMVSNSKAYSVSIRKMNLPSEGFGSVWAYEITPAGSPTPLRGTVSDLPKEELMMVVHAVLTDYQENLGTFSDAGGGSAS